MNETRDTAWTHIRPWAPGGGFRAESKEDEVVRASELIAEQRSHRGAVADAATWALDRYKELLERLGG